MESHPNARLAWRVVGPPPGQSDAPRLLGTLIAPNGDEVRGNMVHTQAMVAAGEHYWGWSVGIYRDWGIHFSRSGRATTKQEASDAANALVQDVINEAMTHDEREAALWAILDAARAPGGEQTLPTLPIAGRDDTFLRSLLWHLGRAERDGNADLIWPGYAALARALSEYFCKAEGRLASVE